MRIIFLDIDGVLNSLRTMLVWAGGLMPAIGKDKQFTQEEVGLDPVAIAMLKLLVKTTDAKIVISSTWRQGSTLDDFHALFDLYGWDTRGVIIGMTPIIHTPGRMRGHEIAKYLSSVHQVVEYIIMDDDSDMLPEQKPRFIKTKAEVGLSHNNVEDALKLFGFSVADLLKVRF